MSFFKVVVALFLQDWNGGGWNLNWQAALLYKSVESCQVISENISQKWITSGCHSVLYVWWDNFLKGALVKIDKNRFKAPWIIVLTIETVLFTAYVTLQYFSVTFECLCPPPSVSLSLLLFSLWPAAPSMRSCFTWRLRERWSNRMLSLWPVACWSSETRKVPPESGTNLASMFTHRHTHWWNRWSTHWTETGTVLWNSKSLG